MTTGEREVGVHHEDGTITCGRMDAPWSCSRELGHEGPCHATRDPRVSKKPTHIECATYTDYQPGFGLYKEQSEAIRKWMKDHDIERHIPAGKTHRYSGAIGGAYTFEFTGTSLGQVVHVKCACGEEIDVSDYDNW